MAFSRPDGDVWRRFPARGGGGSQALKGARKVQTLNGHHIGPFGRLELILGSMCAQLARFGRTRAILLLSPTLNFRCYTCTGLGR